MILEELVFEYLPGLLASVAGWIYFVSVLRMETKLSIPAALVWIVSIAAMLMSSKSLGGGVLFFALAANLTFLVLDCFVAVKRGNFDHRFGLFEMSCLFLVLLGLLLWNVFDAPWWSLSLTLFVDVMGTMLVLAKLVRLPSSESLSSWTLASFGYAIPLFKDVLQPADLAISLVTSIFGFLVVSVLVWQKSGTHSACSCR